jgi:hypothetical protein
MGAKPLKMRGEVLVDRVLLRSRIDEVTFKTCPLLATGRTGVWSGLVNGVLAGTGARDFETTLAVVGKLQQRGFFGLIVSYSRTAECGAKF